VEGGDDFLIRDSTQVGFVKGGSSQIFLGWPHVRI